MSTATPPIVIKKIKKVSGGHHGGAWKVAYADFVTAMMAFFLLLWLLATSSPEIKASISSYFENPSAVEAAGGASTSMIELGSGTEVTRGEGDERNQQYKEEALDPTLIEQDKKRLEELKKQVEEAIEQDAALKAFKDQLKLDITDEGLRIQIVDKDGRPMFDSGGAELKPYFHEVFQALAKLINSVPNKISISGHTDARPFRRADGYGNWELSTDRANTSRRELIRAGVPEDKIARVVGHGDTVLYDKENPYSPINRRISIVVLSKEAEHAMLKDEGNPQAVVGSGSDVSHLRETGVPKLLRAPAGPVARGGIQRGPVARGGIVRDH